MSLEEETKRRFRNRKISASLADVKFENEFFGYNPDQDPTGDIGISLAARANIRAELVGILVQEWTTIHRLYYQMRQDKKRPYTNR